MIVVDVGEGTNLEQTFAKLDCLVPGGGVFGVDEPIDRLFADETVAVLDEVVFPVLDDDVCSKVLKEVVDVVGWGGFDCHCGCGCGCGCGYWLWLSE